MTVLAGGSKVLRGLRHVVPYLVTRVVYHSVSVSLNRD
jgi:hypothetical protein